MFGRDYYRTVGLLKLYDYVMNKIGGNEWSYYGQSVKKKEIKKTFAEMEKLYFKGHMSRIQITNDMKFCILTAMGDSPLYLSGKTHYNSIRQLRKALEKEVIRVDKILNESNNQ